MSYGYFFLGLLLSLYALTKLMQCSRSSHIDGGYALFLPCGVCTEVTAKDGDSL